MRDVNVGDVVAHLQDGLVLAGGPSTAPAPDLAGGTG